ncbi:MAG: prepilin-type N-terminal cleavage/methylation domain-containing protein [Armatimonadetes bacterium]|nr:prepilin-type N-terminal cleavage/methylation domain-containing protein [Armatimonadota bacterium]
MLPGTRPKAGFTILELLLVLSALAIIMSMILSMFGRARDMSYRAQCASNLRQLACAFTLYSYDWNGYWPCPGGLVGDRSYWSQSGNGGIQSYLRQQGTRSVWCCPLMPDWKSKYPPRSYTMNSYLREDYLGRSDIEYPTCVKFLSGIRIGRILQPQRTILLFEGLPLAWAWENEDWYVYIYRCCNWTGVRGYADKIARTINPGRPWHGKFNNYLYADGHIVARPPGKKTAGILSTYREMYDWYVDKAYFERIYKENWSKLVSRE